MANESYIGKGAAKLINGEAGADVAWSVEGLANTAGRVSTQLDLGAAPRPYMYTWSCEVQFQATPAQGSGLELYVAGAPDGDNTQVDGDIVLTDGLLSYDGTSATDPDMRRNLKFIGFVTSENAAASEKCVKSGMFEHYDRYISIVAYNASGAAVNATDSNFRFDLQPMYFVPGA